MNSENKPAGNGNNNHNNHHKGHKNKKKPYYMKKKDQDGAPEVKAEGVAQAEPRKEAPQNGEAKPHAQGGQQNQQNQQKRDEHHPKNNRDNRDRRNHQRDRKREDARGHQSNALHNEAKAAVEEVIEPIVSEEVTSDGTVIETYSVTVEPQVFSPDTEEAAEEPKTEEKEPEKTISVTGVRFKAGGKVYYFDRGELTPKNGSFVIVETSRGQEFGEVAFATREIAESHLVLPLRPIVRIATDEDVAHHKDNKRREDEAFRICAEKIAKHALPMKLIQAEYSFDNSKLLFYFASESRVDFRELVKDLASVFKTRIELRQIGIRDEAKLFGGLGSCGRPLCCSTFLSDFAQVSIKMAKDQGLSLNSGKISGCCGRLMCCLQFEHKTYVDEASKTPAVDSTVKTRDGVGYVTEVNVLKGNVKVKLKDKPDTPPAWYSRDDVTVLAKHKNEEA